MHNQKPNPLISQQILLKDTPILFVEVASQVGARTAASPKKRTGHSVLRAEFLPALDLLIIMVHSGSLRLKPVLHTSPELNN
jgi:hypothetical protein